MKKIKVVIIGGGFGGIYTALNLKKRFNCDDIEVILINRNNYFLFTPLLHEVATGGLTPDSIVEPVREVFRGTCVKFIEDTAIEVDKENRLVKTSLNSFSYDYLVISTGGETNYFNTPGAKENSFTLKNLQDAIALRNHIIETCEKAVNTKNKELLKLSVIGAGPTGVELIAEIVEYIEHTLCSYYKNSGFTKKDIEISLITATPDVIPQFPEKMRKIAFKELKRKGVKIVTNSIVTKIEPNLITFKDGSILKTHTIIWVAGITPSISDIKGISAGTKGRIDSNEYLQTNFDQQIFTLGDVGGAFPMLAQVAVQQAKTVAYNIYAINENISLKKFKFKQKGLLISLGQWYASGNFFGLTFKGRFMWWIWRTVYLFNFISWRKKFEIMMEWTINLFYPRDITLIK